MSSGSVNYTQNEKQMSFTFNTVADMNTAISNKKIPNGAIIHVGASDFIMESGSVKPIITHGENLLDNWYFVGGGSQQGGGQFPINQRDGLVCPSGIPAWKDGQSITTEHYYTIIGWTTGGSGQPAGLIKIDNTDYAVDKLFCIPGYAHDRYGIDRWASGYSTGLEIYFDDDCINVINRGEHWYESLIQPIENFEWMKGKKFTISILVKSDTNQNVRFGLQSNLGDLNMLEFNPQSDKWVLASKTFEIASDYNFSGGLKFTINPCLAENVTRILKIQAVKLELGDMQTLAHQDADGNWVLNDPPPNYQQELAKCQRYYFKQNINKAYYRQLAVGVDNTSAFAGFEFPVPMRTVPNLKINGASNGETISFRNRNDDTCASGTLNCHQWTYSKYGVQQLQINPYTTPFSVGGLYEFEVEADANL